MPINILDKYSPVSNSAFYSSQPYYQRLGSSSQNWEVNNPFKGSNLSFTTEIGGDNSEELAAQNQYLAEQARQRFENEKASFQEMAPNLGEYVYTPAASTLADHNSSEIDSQIGGSFLNRVSVADIQNYLNNPTQAQYGSQSYYTPISDKFFSQPTGVGSDLGDYFINSSTNEITENPYTAQQLNDIKSQYTNRAQKTETDYNIQNQKNRGFLGTKVGPLLKTAVPLAIATIGTAGLGSALGAFGAGASGAGLTSEALLAAPTGGFGAGASSVGGSSFLGGLGSSFAPKAALSGALKGGISGYASGGDFLSALKGAAAGGFTGGYGDAIASGLDDLTGWGADTFTGALNGASGGLAQGDYKGAALGAALGGASGYYQGGGFGQAAGTSLDKVSGIAGAQGPTQGTGLTGALTRQTNSLSNSLSGLTGGSSFTGGNMSTLGSALKVGGSIYGDYTNRKTNEDIEKRLLESRNQALAQTQPYQQQGLQAQNQLSAALAAGFSPTDLENDAGYQFQLAQGEKALGRGLSASGMTQSGAALKALQEHGQGLASTRYNDSYNQWLQQNSQLQGVANTGYNAAQGAANIYGDIGNIQASRTDSDQESRNQLIAALTGLF